MDLQNPCNFRVVQIRRRGSSRGLGSKETLTQRRREIQEDGNFLLPFVTTILVDTFRSISSATSSNLLT